MSFSKGDVNGENMLNNEFLWYKDDLFLLLVFRQGIKIQPRTRPRIRPRILPWIRTSADTLPGLQVCLPTQPLTRGAFLQNYPPGRRGATKPRPWNIPFGGPTLYRGTTGATRSLWFLGQACFLRPAVPSTSKICKGAPLRLPNLCPPRFHVCRPPDEIQKKYFMKNLSAFNFLLNGATV